MIIRSDNFLSANKNRIVRKCLLVLVVDTAVALELAVLLTFLNMYSLLAAEFYWGGLVALVAVFFVSVRIIQTVAEVKCPTELS